MKVSFHALAERELNEAARYYELERQRHAGGGIPSVLNRSMAVKITRLSRF